MGIILLALIFFRCVFDSDLDSATRPRLGAMRLHDGMEEQ
jgi:hypothetical protein